jgi:hypothetical protein
MKKKNFGVAVIFNFKIFEFNSSYRMPFRKGADKNVEYLYKVLGDFGYDVRIYQDLTTREVKNVIKNVSEENHENNNSLLIAVMSHGTENRDICTFDSKISVSDFWKPFSNPNTCPSLIGKPKIFFIQACRGKF